MSKSETRVSMTYVRAADDWQGVYVGDELQYENHRVSVSDISIPEDKVVEEITKKDFSITKLGMTHLPSTLSAFNKMIEFAETVEEEYETWKQQLKTCFEEHPDDNLTVEEVKEKLSLTETNAKVLVSLYSPEKYKASYTPLRKDPLLKKDLDTKKNDSITYQLV